MGSAKSRSKTKVICINRINRAANNSTITAKLGAKLRKNNNENKGNSNSENG